MVFVEPTDNITTNLLATPVVGQEYYVTNTGSEFSITLSGNDNNIVTKTGTTVASLSLTSGQTARVLFTGTNWHEL